jgi:hypothetical protein
MGMTLSATLLILSGAGSFFARGQSPNLNTAFSPFRSIAVQSWPECVVIGDFNNDGRQDVVLGFDSYGQSTNNNSLLVFLQDATGGLAEPVHYPAGGAVSALAAGDFNGDGRTDVAVGRLTTGIRVFYQGPSGRFESSANLPAANSRWICAGDFNGDRRADLAGIGWSGGVVEVLVQTAAGTMTNAGPYMAPYDGFNDLEAADVTGDGLTDLIVMSGQGSTTLSVLRQIPGGFAPAQTQFAGGRGIGVGELNGDGRLDVAVSVGGNSPSSKMVFWLQQAAGTIAPAKTNTCYDIPESVVVADVDADGRDDVLCLHGGWERVGVYFQIAPGSFSTEFLYEIPYASHYNALGLAVGDINNDGMPDLAIADYNNGLVLLTNRLSRPIKYLTDMENDSGNARFRLNGRTGYRYVIDISTDLVTWVPFRTNSILAGNSIWIEDPSIPEETHRFYRARELDSQGINNDPFSNRISIPGAGGTVQGSNIEATKEAGEPNHAGDTGGKSVWWTWTPTVGGIYTITTDGSSFDTTLGVYRGTSVSSLILVADDDDSGEARQSRVLINASAGSTYQIAVDGYEGASGSVTLSVRSGNSNDNFANRWPMSGIEDEVIGVSFNATREIGEPFHWPGTGGASIWWTWQAPFSDWVLLSTGGSDFDTILAAYTGSSVNALTLVANNDDAPFAFDGSSEVRFFATAGTTYHLAVDGYGGARGVVVLYVQQ